MNVCRKQAGRFLHEAPVLVLLLLLLPLSG
jgi:hypothetical protein